MKSDLPAMSGLCRDLGPRQLAWLKANIPSFSHSWRSAEAARREQEKNRRLMENHHAA